MEETDRVCNGNIKFICKWLLLWWKRIFRYMDKEYRADW